MLVRCDMKMERDFIIHTERTEHENSWHYKSPSPTFEYFEESPSDECVGEQSLNRDEIKDC
jgi:hypothetical protein